MPEKTTIGFRAGPELKHRIELYAEQNELTKSEAVRRAVEEGIEELENRSVDPSYLEIARTAPARSLGGLGAIAFGSALFGVGLLALALSLVELFTGAAVVDPYFFLAIITGMIVAGIGTAGSGLYLLDKARLKTKRVLSSADLDTEQENSDTSAEPA